MTVITKMKMILLHLDNHKKCIKNIITIIYKTPLGETGCLINPYFLLTGCLGIHFFIHSQHSQLGYFWLPTPHCAVLV